MNHSGLGHLKWMVLTAVGLFGVLLLVGKSPGDALSYALLLACPLMMVAMMIPMMRSGHGGDQTKPVDTRGDTDERVGTTGHHHSP